MIYFGTTCLPDAIVSDAIDAPEAERPLQTV